MYLLLAVRDREERELLSVVTGRSSHSVTSGCCHPCRIGPLGDPAGPGRGVLQRADLEFSGFLPAVPASAIACQCAGVSALPWSGAPRRVRHRASPG